MLIEFSVANFGAFSDEQTFTMVATRLKDGVQTTPFQSSTALDLQILPFAAILGKNGSGKSTLISAMRFVRKFVSTSAFNKEAGESIAHNPNLLVDDLSVRPSRFRIVFEASGSIFQYEFCVDAHRVIEERLDVADRTPRFRNLFSRSFLDSSDEYTFKFGESLSGDKAVWRDATRADALFLSIAAQLNSDVLRVPFYWIAQSFRPISALSNLWTFTARRCAEDEWNSRVSSFLRGLDIPVHRIRIDFDEERSASRAGRPTVFFTHSRRDGSLVDFPFKIESSGTQALFGLIGPILDVLENGYCLVVDELNTNIHPLVFGSLVQLFSDRDINKRNAQLIFTTHDTHILTHPALRRDQTWFVDNDGEGAKLKCLSDFSPRKGEALQRGYVVGRYGGIPVSDPVEWIVNAEKKQRWTAEESGGTGAA